MQDYMLTGGIRQTAGWALLSAYSSYAPDQAISLDPKFTETTIQGHLPFTEPWF